MPADNPGPSFLVIGAARSGTTALTHHLQRHPAVFVTDPKEPHFLAFAGRRVAFRGPGDDETINRLSITDPTAWRELYRTGRDRAVRGEGSVSTLYYAARSTQSIERYCPDVRLIAILRDPVDRAWSAHQYLAARGYETETFDRALDLERVRIAEGWHHLWHYTEMGRYARQLVPFLEAVGPERLLVLDHDDLVRDPSAVLERVFAFLDLEAVPLDGLSERINVSGAPRSRMIAGAVGALRRRPAARQVMRSAVPFSVREHFRRANSRQVAMPSGARARLVELFAPERDDLVTLLGPGAPGWAVAG